MIDYKNQKPAADPLSILDYAAAAGFILAMVCILFIGV